MDGPRLRGVVAEIWHQQVLRAPPWGMALGSGLGHLAAPGRPTPRQHALHAAHRRSAGVLCHQQELVQLTLHLLTGPPLLGGRSNLQMLLLVLGARTEISLPGILLERRGGRQLTVQGHGCIDVTSLRSAPKIL